MNSIMSGMSKFLKTSERHFFAQNATYSEQVEIKDLSLLGKGHWERKDREKEKGNDAV